MIGLILVFVLILGLGVLFSLGKGASLIAGYNTMSREKKEKYDSVALCKFMGKVMFAVAAAMLFYLAARWYPGYHLQTIGQCVVIVVVLVALVYANTGNRFRKKS